MDALNSELTSLLDDIDSVLSWTLDFDDRVDLHELRRTAVHPPFSSPHEKPLPAPDPIAVPPEPSFTEPTPPTGMSALFGKKKHVTAVEQAREVFEKRHASWRAKAAKVPRQQLEQMKRHQAAEAEREAKLAVAHEAYDVQCKQRQAEVDQHNAQLDTLIARLESGEKSAVEEYIGIVFGNSVYPDPISLEIDHTYHPGENELEVELRLPAPADLTSVRGYRYVKAKDEIAETMQSAKEQRDRYAKLVHESVLRTLHEVWESDQLGHVKTISLTAGVDHIDPATGRPARTTLVAVAAHRSDFESINLAHVTPLETLKHLKAVVSKNPHALAPIELPDGVRG